MAEKHGAVLEEMTGRPGEDNRQHTEIEIAIEIELEPGHQR